MEQRDLSTWLRIEMAKRNLNDIGLARLLDISHVAIGHWRRGERTPNYGNCIKLARFFDIAEEEVLIIAGHRQPQVIGSNPGIAEPNPTYSTDPRARLHALLDQLTDDQIELLTNFLESIK